MKKFNFMALIVIVLMVGMLAVQFVPSWPGADGAKISTSDYVWFPEHNKDTTKTVKEIVADSKFKVDEIVGVSVLMLVLPLAAIVACIMIPQHVVAPILSAVTGLVGVSAVATNRGFMAAYNDGGMLLMLSIVCILVGTVACSAALACHNMAKMAQKQA